MKTLKKLSVLAISFLLVLLDGLYFSGCDKDDGLHNTVGPVWK